MRQAIRALGWATTIFWIMLLFFTVTAVYSALQIKPGFGRPVTSTSGATLMLSLPFSIANDGVYDIASLNLTTSVSDSQGVSMATNSTYVKLIPHGANVSVTHNMSIGISEMSWSNAPDLLFNDTVLDMDIALEADYANVVPIRISTSLPFSWGAPLSNLTLGTILVMPYNSTHAIVAVPFSFENHSFFAVDGNMRLELVSNAGRVVGGGTVEIEAQPSEAYRNTINVIVSDNVRIVREAHLHFETSFFRYGPVVIPLV